MNYAQNRLNKAIFAVLAMVLTLGFRVAPVRAELSPDAGLETEQFQVQQAEEERIAQEEAKKAAALEEQRKLEEKKRADAKKKAEVAAAKKKAAAEAAKKRQEELAKKLGDSEVVTTATLVPTSFYQDNVSVAARDVPEGLTPVVIAEALSTKPGKAASVTVKTLPGATCNIDVFVVQRTPISAPGLGDKVASEDGTCSWTWTVKPGTPRGSWGIRIQANKDGKSDDTWTTLNIGAVH